MTMKVDLKCSDSKINVDVGAVNKLSEEEKQEYEKKLHTLELDKNNAYDHGFEEGKRYEYDTFWDSFQDNGKRRNYSRVFAGEGWNDINFKPKYNLIVTESAANMFSDASIRDLEGCLKRAGVTLNVSGAARADYMFYYAATEIIPKLDVSNVKNISYMFNRARDLHTIRELKLSDKGDQNLGAEFFFQCTSLKNISIEGMIGCDLDMSYSPLSAKSFESIIFSLSIEIEPNTKTAVFMKSAVDKAFETYENANDGSDSEAWSYLCGNRPMWNIRLI